MDKIAFKWWMELTFEEQFYKVIEFIGTNDHPDRVSIENIIKIYKACNVL